MKRTDYCNVISAALAFCAMVAWLDPASAAVDPALVARGKYLASAGDCQACHTQPGGTPYAGGRYIDTPFGQLPSPNITPDVRTGIGAWTDDQFYRALHEGIGGKGQYLYPVMPFPWYTIVTRDDALAIKAYLFSLRPVSRPALPSKLGFPYSVRTSLAAWRALFFKPATFTPDAQRSAQVNRGDYLVNGLAHCGECHNSRPVAGTSKWRKPFAGGVIDNWYAPNITSDARGGVGDWTEAQLAHFLKTGVSPSKGIALGPMAETIHSLAQLSDADLAAMAAYLKSIPPTPTDASKYPLYEGAQARGGQTYLDHCASCHGLDSKGLEGVIPALAGNGAVTSGGPQNVMRVVVGGLPAAGTYAPMAAVGAAMTDTEVADVTNYVRQSWGNAAPPTAEPGMVAGARRDTSTPLNPADATACTPVPAELTAALSSRASPTARMVRSLGDGHDLARISALAAQADRELAAVPRAERVNTVMGLYCRTLQQRAGMDRSARALQLGQFGEFLYAATRDAAQH